MTKPIKEVENRTQNCWGVAYDLRMNIALDIVKHCALVVGQEDGEDTAGRAKMRLLPAKETATRALDIADALVNGGLERGWIFDRTVSDEEAAFHTGRLNRFKDTAHFESREEARAALASLASADKEEV